MARHCRRRRWPPCCCSRLRPFMPCSWRHGTLTRHAGPRRRDDVQPALPRRHGAAHVASLAPCCFRAAPDDRTSVAIRPRNISFADGSREQTIHMAYANCTWPGDRATASCGSPMGSMRSSPAASSVAVPAARHPQADSFDGDASCDSPPCCSATACGTSCLWRASRPSARQVRRAAELLTPRRRCASQLHCARRDLRSAGTGA